MQWLLVGMAIWAIVSMAFALVAGRMLHARDCHPL
jgi:uncharacterized membrane protein YecN with MAPEG domain